MPTVLICPSVLRNKPGEYSRILEEAEFTVRYPVCEVDQLTEADLLVHLDGAVACLAGSEPYSKTVLDRFPGLRVISRAGVGYDAVDVESASIHRIAVAITPGTNHDGVAEQTMAMILGIAKMVVDNHAMVVSGKFPRRITAPLRGRTLGIVGMGRIGRAVAERALAFGMTVLVHELFPTRAAHDLTDVKFVTLEDLLSHSDIVSLHTPLTDETRRLIRDETIERMKHGVVIINTARGGLVDETALAAALHSGKVSAAALDVFADEPPVGSPLLTAPNTLLSPHIAGIDSESLNQMAIMAAQTIVDLHRGTWPEERIVNARELTRQWKW